MDFSQEKLHETIKGKRHRRGTSSEDSIPKKRPAFSNIKTRQQGTQAPDDHGEEIKIEPAIDLATVASPKIDSQQPAIAKQ